ncbi:MAG: serine hydrolase [Clostridia bacterium]|nr:serine hydrolase [Clostridia bacterium]
MKRRSIALSAAVALLSMVITGCANFPSGNSSGGITPTSSIATEVTEPSIVSMDVVPTTSTILTTTTLPLTTTETTTQIVTTTTQTTTLVETTTTQTTTTTQEMTTTTMLVTETTASAPVTTQPAVTTTFTTAAPIVTTAAPTVPVTPASGFQELPTELMQIVNKYKSKYPGMSIGVGIYSLDGTAGYEYNATQLFNGACTIKASYALYVCSYCDENGIDIWSKKLYYDTTKHHHGGSGVIYDKGSKWYTIGELLTYLLQVSDNDAMKCLITDFLPMSGYYQFNSALGGESDWANWNGGRASVQQRKNEWIAIWNYINSGAPNSQNLKTFLSNTQYCYLVKGMSYIPPYLHKSGWCDSYSYPAAADCAIIQNRSGSYLMIVMNQDYSTGNGHTDAIAELGNAIDDYWYSPGFFWRN